MYNRRRNGKKDHKSIKGMHNRTGGDLGDELSKLLGRRKRNQKRKYLSKNGGANNNDFSKEKPRGPKRWSRQRSNTWEKT